jgi:uncharacterized protein YecE (DUF72 family)
MSRQTVQWHIGLSGFHYKEWKEVFYPKGLPQRAWFDHYCKYFDTLELNVTFYRFPELSSLQNWYHKSPAHFLFAVKAPQLITHFKKFENTWSLLNDFYTTVRNGLQEKLGCVLFQLPPQLQYSEALLQKIIMQMDSSFTNVIEFRHKSWWQPRVYDALAQHHITFCSISHPLLSDEVIINTDLVYYRFHGVPDLYYSAYADHFLLQVANAIQNAKQVKRAFLYFNNTAQTAAIPNAQYLQQELLKNINQ